MSEESVIQEWLRRDLEAINTKLQQICSSMEDIKTSMPKDLDTRLRSLEEARSRMSGQVTLLVALAGALGAFIPWILSKIWPTK